VEVAPAVLRSAPTVTTTQFLPSCTVARRPRLPPQLAKQVHGGLPQAAIGFHGEWCQRVAVGFKPAVGTPLLPAPPVHRFLVRPRSGRPVRDTWVTDTSTMASPDSRAVRMSLRASRPAVAEPGTRSVPRLQGPAACAALAPVTTRSWLASLLSSVKRNLVTHAVPNHQLTLDMSRFWLR
jgi:hypothetical protein